MISDGPSSVQAPRASRRDRMRSRETGGRDPPPRPGGAGRTAVAVSLMTAPVRGGDAADKPEGPRRGTRTPPGVLLVEDRFDGGVELCRDRRDIAALRDLDQ